MTADVRARAFRNILVPTDFSPCSETVLPYAASLARKSGATLFLAHVVSPEILSIEPPVVLEVRDAAERQMQDLLISEQLEGIHHKALFGEGDTTEAIMQMVQDNAIDMIVLATHGRTGIRKFVMGSVAEEIFRKSPCPVLILGPKVCTDARHDARFCHIMYATDFAPDATAGFSYVRSIADTDAVLTLLHVVPTAPIVEPETATAILRRKLLELVPSDLEIASPPEAVVEIGEPAEWIVRDAAERHADLIILGCRRSAALTSHFMDTAYKVIIEAPCPVLTISASYKAVAA